MKKILICILSALTIGCTPLIDFSENEHLRIESEGSKVTTEIRNKYLLIRLEKLRVLTGEQAQPLIATKVQKKKDYVVIKATYECLTEEKVKVPSGILLVHGRYHDHYSEQVSPLKREEFNIEGKELSQGEIFQTMLIYEIPTKILGEVFYITKRHTFAVVGQLHKR